MSRICLQGHTSVSTDYCDTCGTPMDAVRAPAAPAVSSTPAPAPAAAAAPTPAAAPTTRPCPLCGATNEVDDLFCEACGYDFTTGATPDGPAVDLPDTRAESSLLDIDAPLLGADGGGPPSDTEPDPAPEPEPAEPAASATPPVPSAPAAPPHVRPAHTPPSRQLSSDWVVEVWIDPQWFAVQQGDQPCPSPGIPDIVPARGRTVLIGRPSASRNVHPDVDCGADTGVSRRHAQLSSDGRRWWIEDLGSSNGTFVGAAGDALPVDPIAVGQRLEVDADERIYVGAWTRLVIRPATDSEKAGTG